MTHVSTITFPFSLFETLLNKPSKNLSKSKFSRYTTKIKFQIKFLQIFLPISNSNEKKDSRGSKERKEKKRKRIEHPLVFDPQRKRTSRAHRSTQPPPPRSLPAFVQIAQKLLELFFIAKLAPCLPPFLCGVAPRSRFPFSLPPSLSLSRDYRGREKLVGGDWISFLRTRSACDYRDSGNCPTSRLLFFRVHV